MHVPRLLLPTGPRRWSVAGLVAGAGGLAVSYFVAMVLTVADPPVSIVVNLIIGHAPEFTTDRSQRELGAGDRWWLSLLVLALVLACTAWAGRLARQSWWEPMLVFGILAAALGSAVFTQASERSVDYVPIAAAFAVWLIALSLMTEPLQAEQRRVADSAPPGHTRRSLLIRAGVILVGSTALTVVGRIVGQGRRHVEETRRLLRLPQVTSPSVPAGADLDIEGLTPWLTRVEDFFVEHTAIAAPTIEPGSWQLRIHGLVEQEVVLDYNDLLDLEMSELWMTLSCVTNQVGGDQVGNAWWSGVQVADLLARAGVRGSADAVLQTSADGWTCVTPLSAMIDDRGALLAIAMNGEPLSIDHGFPARVVVPGLFGNVSACKWVVDLEVTTFQDATGQWTEKGWSEEAPVRMASRIDRPVAGSEVVSGRTQVAGLAWVQQTGIQGVEVAVDGGGWQRAEIAEVPSINSWVQWVTTVDLAPGEHLIKVRAIDRNGDVQTGVASEPKPDGATGWHEVEVTALTSESAPA